MEGRLEARIKELLGEDVKVVFVDVPKNNGLVQRAVNILDVKEKVSAVPTIYVDEALEDVECGEATIEEVADWIVSTYNEHIGEVSMVKEIMDGINKDFILSRVEYQMINRESNAERLQGLPHTDLLDLACIYRCMVDEIDGSFVITDSVAEKYGISFEELERAARANTSKSGFTVKSMLETIAGMMGNEFVKELDEMGLWVLTNKKRVYGANIMCYPEYFEDLANKLDSDLYIMPSSIHEVLAIKVGVIDKEELADMVNSVNTVSVQEDEILGEKVYIYSRETKELSIA